MVSISKLKGKMAENDMSVSDLAEKIGVDKATLYRKLNSQGESFSIKEADSIATTLKLTPEEASSIFFSQYVADMR